MKPGLKPTPIMMIVRADGSVYEREAGWCPSCRGPTCPACDGRPCVPYEKRVEAEERAARTFLCEAEAL